MNGPLGSSEPEIEADVIVSAVVVGFSLTRVIQGQPFSFDVEPSEWLHGDDGERIRRCVDLVLDVLRTAGYVNSPELITAGQSSQFQSDDPGANLITGRAGGEALQPSDRREPMRDYYAVEMGKWEANSASDGQEAFEGQYHGFGAYTGMINDPIRHHTLIQPTIRRVITDPGRWCPSDGLWGLIDTKNQGGESGDNLSRVPSIGMGPLRRHAGIVQYVHGMSWAMREAVRWGPWCTAYEMAVGAKTRKLASCFACTTYMWASGFPASSTHLGRGDSWGTLPDGSLGHGEDHVFSDSAEGEIERSIARSMNARWNVQIGHYARRGAALLSGNIEAVDAAHRPAARALALLTDRYGPAEFMRGGDLFLDALTWHKRDMNRVLDTLKRG